MKIKEIKPVIPAYLTYENDGREFTVLCYIDHSNKTITTPGRFFDDQSFCKEAYKWFQSESVKGLSTPKVPKEGFRLKSKNLTP